MGVRGGEVQGHVCGAGDGGADHAFDGDGKIDVGGAFIVGACVICAIELSFPGENSVHLIDAQLVAAVCFPDIVFPAGVRRQGQALACRPDVGGVDVVVGEGQRHGLGNDLAGLIPSDGGIKAVITDLEGGGIGAILRGERRSADDRRGTVGDHPVLRDACEAQISVLIHGVYGVIAHGQLFVAVLEDVEISVVCRLENAGISVGVGCVGVSRRIGGGHLPDVAAVALESHFVCFFPIAAVHYVPICRPGYFVSFLAIQGQPCDIGAAVRREGDAGRAGVGSDQTVVIRTVDAFIHRRSCGDGSRQVQAHRMDGEIGYG